MKSENPHDLQLGDIVKDSISGFEGVFTCESKWLNGCTRITLTPKTMHEGKLVPHETFDIEQLVLVKKMNKPAAPRHGDDRETISRT